MIAALLTGILTTVPIGIAIVSRLLAVTVVTSLLSIAVVAVLFPITCCRSLSCARCRVGSCGDECLGAKLAQYYSRA